MDPIDPMPGLRPNYSTWPRVAKGPRAANAPARAGVVFEKAVGLARTDWATFVLENNDSVASAASSIAVSEGFRFRSRRVRADTHLESSGSTRMPLLRAASRREPGSAHECIR
jgi:hypothetical protein